MTQTNQKCFHFKGNKSSIFFLPPPPLTLSTESFWKFMFISFPTLFCIFSCHINVNCEEEQVVMNVCNDVT